MMEALKHRGYQPPALHRRSDPRAVANGPHNAPLPKELALHAITSGDAIPPTVMQKMKETGWTGPGLTARSLYY